MGKVQEYSYNTFDDIKHVDEYGNEFWNARELQKVLEYKEWRNFSKVINKAKEACINSNLNILDHFVEINKMVDIGSKTKREIDDYKLTRYACYLIVQNSNPSKEVVALGQTYFAIQTRKQEITEQEYELLSEDEKRFYQRKLTKKGNYSLNRVAVNAGVKNLDKFHNAGYRGLYNGETANDIAKNGGIMPEKLPTPNKSLKELEKESKKIEHKKLQEDKFNK